MPLVPRHDRVVKCEHCGSLYPTPARDGTLAIESEALALLAEDLADAREDCWRFFRAVWAPMPGYATVRRLAADCAVSASSLNSRFLRAGLPSPKRYVLASQLTRAAWLFENRHITTVQVAEALGASSAQAFGRTVRMATGLTPRAFRQRYDGAGMLAQFRRELVTPYRDALRTMAPLVGGPTQGVA